MQDNTKTKGNQAERIAIQILQENGFRIIKRNVWLTIPNIGRREIDIVCEKDGVLVLIEVRSRFHKADTQYSALNSVNSTKLTHMEEAAQYLIANPPEWLPQNINQVRIDLLCIDFFGEVAKVQHFTNVKSN